MCLPVFFLLLHTFNKKSTPFIPAFRLPDFLASGLPDFPIYSLNNITG